MEIGDIVTLKCNPEIKMVIFNLYNRNKYSNNDRVFCHWIDKNGQLQEQEFNSEELKVKNI